MGSPLVSIIIPTYKNIESLPKAIDSVLNQTYPNIEIIVVDDNNPNSEFRTITENLMQKYRGNSAVHYIKNDKNLERAITRNNGARFSHGQYLMFLDNDDQFYERKIESQVKRLETLGKEYAVSYSNYVRCKNDKIVMVCGEHREGNLYVEALARNLFVHPGSNLMIRREAFFEVGGFNSNLNINEDLDMLVKLLFKYKIAYCDVMGLKVNVHESLIRNYDYEESTRKFINIESNLIETLTEVQQTKIMKTIGLQLFRFYLNSPKNSKRIAKTYCLSFKDRFRYLLYMLKRILTKKTFGFDIV